MSMKPQEESLKTEGKQHTYSKKIQIPVFEPSEYSDVQLEECVNIDKYVILVEEIDEEYNKHNISLEEAKFLKLCATRWIMFNYANVAEYYATKGKNNPTFQKLIERSGMVLVDVDKAFANAVIESKQFVHNIANSYISENIDNFSDYLLKEEAERVDKLDFD